MSDRGFRNCNPGNIRHGAVKWQGMAIEQTDPDFVQFTDPVWGLRAIARIMYSYERDGITTIDGAINRWAPPSDSNPTAAYVHNVCEACGVGADDKVSLSDHLLPIIKAIVVQENGSNPYTDATINDGITRAGI
jgi:hypothetical protein